MKWDDFKIFSVVASATSLTAAARDLHLSVATVSRRLEALERDLGIRLIERSPEGIRLTAQGSAVLERGAPATEALDDASRLASALRAGGWAEPIRVTATSAVVSEILAPALPLLFSAAPSIRIDLSVDNEIVSIAARKADIAIRMVRPTGDSLLVRRIVSLKLALFASPAYLRGRDPTSLILSEERLLGYDDSHGSIPEAVWFKASGLGGAIALRTSSTMALVKAARAGAGIAILPDFLAQPAGPDGGLIYVPAPMRLPARDVWLVSHKDFKGDPAFRQVRRWVVAAFANTRLERC